MPTPKEIEQDLKSLAEEIDKSTDNISRAEGRREALFEQLKNLGVDSLEKAHEKIKELEEDEKELEREISEEYAELKRKYTW